MKSIPKKAALVLCLPLLGAALTACGGDDGADVVDGKTFTMAITDDPGSLDPQIALSGTLLQLNRFAYDSLVGIDDDGTIVPQLAASWKVGADEVTFEIRDGVTCSDGSAFTADTVVQNLNFVSDPGNQSQFRGVYMPPGATASASGPTVTLKLATPSPFVLNGLAHLPMVCDAGLKDRSMLKSASSGTGPYVLDDVAAGDHYTYQVREGYTWGPDGATTDEPGTPAKVNVRVITNETTAANELLAGSINAAKVLGPDRDRLAKSDLASHEQLSIFGEQWYNQASGRPAHDPDVRMALTQALDLKALRTALTSGDGEPPTQLAVAPPAACKGDAATGSVPSHDLDAAKSALEKAGWAPGSDGIRVKDGRRLTLTFGYATLLGTPAGATAELAVKQWKEAGVEAKPKQMTQAEWSALFATGDWDVLWLPSNGSTPDQFVPMLSGPTPPNGNNFSAIHNDKYEKHVAEALKSPGADGCDEWLAAESALFENADLVPFANQVITTFAKDATFELSGPIIPTSIRMLG